MGFRLNLKWAGLSVHSSLPTTSSSLPTSYCCKSRVGAYVLARLSISSVLYGEAETLNGHLRPHSCASCPQILEKNYLRTKEIEVELSKESSADLLSFVRDNAGLITEDDKFTFLTSLQANETSRFSLLMKNLYVLEEIFTDADAVRLKRDILKQIKRLGALSLFHACLSRGLKSSSVTDIAHATTELVKDPRENEAADAHVGKVVIPSGKKELRRSRRKRALYNSNNNVMHDLHSETVPKDSKPPSRGRPPKSRNKRLKVTRNEAELSSGIKLVAELESKKMMLEEETGQTATLSGWAEASGIEMKALQQHLQYGSYCKDELLRSTRSLVVFIARNYSGLGVSFEDLIQAGNVGVLQGAERFDQSRGYKFSTYVQYWIRKSMSTLVARHARGVRIPFTLSKVINQVHKARKALSMSHGRHPDDSEIAKFTGLSINKITSADKCLRVVGSIDQKLGESISAKFLEVTPDTSVMSPEESVMQQHMVQDVYTLLRHLEPRERQVLTMRFGLGNHQRKSLEEIGKLFCVSKEWIRRIERRALTKLRDKDSVQNLSHYCSYISSK